VLGGTWAPKCRLLVLRQFGRIILGNFQRLLVIWVLYRAEALKTWSCRSTKFRTQSKNHGCIPLLIFDIILDLQPLTSSPSCLESDSKSTLTALDNFWGHRERFKEASLLTCRDPRVPRAEQYPTFGMNARVANSGSWLLATLSANLRTWHQFSISHKRLYYRIFVSKLGSYSLLGSQTAVTRAKNRSHQEWIHIWPVRLTINWMASLLHTKTHAC